MVYQHDSVLEDLFSLPVVWSCDKVTLSSGPSQSQSKNTIYAYKLNYSLCKMVVVQSSCNRV